MTAMDYRFMQFAALCAGFMCLLAVLVTQHHNISPTAVSAAFLPVLWVFFFGRGAHNAHPGMLVSLIIATGVCIMGLFFFWLNNTHNQEINVVVASTTLLGKTNTTPISSS